MGNSPYIPYPSRMIGLASTATIKVRYMRSRFWSRAPFPLTPGEREDHRQSAGQSEVAPTCERWGRRLPLPGGEGRGEGEGDLQQPTGRDVTKLLYHRT